ncbi:MAG: DapH/DapD/GlmU-related protein [Myxococcales bacterium]
MILGYWSKPQTFRNVLWAIFACDPFIILLLFRTRQWLRRHHVPVVNRVMRMMETTFFAIELGNDVELGHGVLFMHSVGTVVGGNAKIGEAVIFLGSNTIGENGGAGYPRIGARTVIGAGARILGGIEVGDDCVIGANAVVVSNVPSEKVALGIPARIAGDNKNLREPFPPDPQVGVEP